MVQRLSVFGLGKLGLPLAGLFARSGLRTVAIDVDFDLVEQLRAGKIPVVEPGLDELVAAAGWQLLTPPTFRTQPTLMPQSLSFQPRSGLCMALYRVPV